MKVARVLKRDGMYYAQGSCWTPLLRESFHFYCDSYAYEVAEHYGAKVVRVKTVPNKRTQWKAASKTGREHVLRVLRTALNKNDTSRDTFLLAADFLESVK